MKLNLCTGVHIRCPAQPVLCKGSGMVPSRCFPIKENTENMEITIVEVVVTRISDRNPGPWGRCHHGPAPAGAFWHIGMQCNGVWGLPAWRGVTLLPQTQAGPLCTERSLGQCFLSRDWFSWLHKGAIRMGASPAHPLPFPARRQPCRPSVENPPEASGDVEDLHCKAR